ncbi:hypothetical protein Tco_1215727 [Tanacetum coccineum]
MQEIAVTTTGTYGQRPFIRPSSSPWKIYPLPNGSTEPIFATSCKGEEFSKIRFRWSVVSQLKVREEDIPKNCIQDSIHDLETCIKKEDCTPSSPSVNSGFPKVQFPRSRELCRIDCRGIYVDPAKIESSRLRLAPILALPWRKAKIFIALMRCSRSVEAAVLLSDYECENSLSPGKRANVVALTLCQRRKEMRTSKEVLGIIDDIGLDLP